ncbi:MAG TPA: glycoside hydrolase family 18 protein [Egibacteraceae bacterium]|nr:glycoside hydrolase family 18 protein [Egibacteraceae bacterium]
MITMLAPMAAAKPPTVPRGKPQAGDPEIVGYFIQVGGVRPAVLREDFATFQGYDLAGAWDLSSTNHHSKLFAPQGDPLSQFSVDQTVQAYLDRGAPAHKLVMGVPFYGRGWTGVADVNNGLYQPATAAAPGTFEAGFEDYKVLKTLTDQGFTRYWDAEAQVPWLFDGTTFWTYDDPESLGIKAEYVNDNGLGGMMFWEVTGDTSNGELITAIHSGLTE